MTFLNNLIMLPEVIFVVMYLGVMCVALFKKECVATSIACGIAMLFHTTLALSVDSFSNSTAWLYYFIAAFVNTILLYYILQNKSSKNRGRGIYIPLCFLAALPYFKSIETFLFGINSDIPSLMNLLYVVGIPLAHGWLILSLFNGDSGGRPRFNTKLSRGTSAPLYKHIAACLARSGSEYTYQKCIQQHQREKRG